jgi:signal transduction histidine kinase/CheY-like chemotaxis protein
MPYDHHIHSALASGVVSRAQSFLLDPALRWIHGLSHTFIGIAYYAISFQIVYLALRRRNSQYRNFYWLLCSFVFAAGTMNLMIVWTIWNPAYWVSGGVSAVTAILSIITAIVLTSVIPTTASMQSPAEIEKINRELTLARDAATKLALEKAQLAREKEELAHEKDVAAQAAAAAARELALVRELAISRDATTLSSLELERARSEARSLAGAHDAETTAAELARVLAEARSLAAAHKAAIATAAELAEARDAALRADRLKSEFLANMSHEIRTPLNGIVGMSELLRESKLTSDQRDFTKIICSSADSLLTIVNDILDFSKIAAGKLVFEEIDFELTSAVESVTTLLSERTSKKDIELLLQIDPQLPSYLRGDPVRLRQVLFNLLGNAIKFTDHGEVAIALRLVRREGRKVTIQVKISDTGIGISPEARLQLFQPFHQADGSTTRKYGGTGLGLAISSQLVELMGGRIEVESELGKGSTFVFTASFANAATAPIAKSFKTLTGLRAVVVDDNRTNRQIVERQIASWGVASASSPSGSDALALLREPGRDPFDVGILDLQMPGMDGLMLAQLIKSDPALSKMRLLMMSSVGGRAEAGGNSGLVESWLIKPVRQAQLYDSLAALMSSKIANVEPIAEVPSRRKEPESTAGFEMDPLHQLRNQFRILVVEDNDINRSVAIHQLHRIGYLCDVVGGGAEALEAIANAEKPYPLVLMDWMMPGMDGFAATAELRSREGDSGRHITVVAMTANVLEGDRQKCLAAGMNDYIGKPVQIAELTATLDRWLLPTREVSLGASGVAKGLALMDHSQHLEPPVVD